MARQEKERDEEHDEKQDVHMRPAVAENAADQPGIDLLEARRIQADDQQDLQCVQAGCDGNAVEDEFVGRGHATALVREKKDKSRSQSAADDSGKRLLPDAEARCLGRPVDEQHDAQGSAGIDAQEARARQLILGDGLEYSTRDSQPHADEDGQDGSHHAEVKYRQDLLRCSASQKHGNQMRFREIVEPCRQVQEEEPREQCCQCE